MIGHDVMERVKIFRVIARLNIGGPAIHTILLSSRLKSLGYETLLVAGQVGANEADMNYLAQVERVEPVIIPRLGRRLLPLADLLAFLRILRLLFRWRPSIVHTHTAKAGAVGRAATAVYNTAQGARHRAQGIVRRRFRRQGTRGQKEAIDNGKCKVVHTFHGHVLSGYFSPLKSKFFQLIEKMLAKCTDAIVVVSEAQRKELSGKYGIGKAEQYRVIPLGLNLGQFTQGATKRFAPRPDLDGKRLVAIIGRLTAIKNHSLFLESVSAIVKNQRDTRAKFLIVGDGELREDLEKMVKDLELEERVIFTGWIRDLGSLYADLDVLAVTSDNEGTPVAVIEAMAAGVPVIATDVGGVRELISEWGMGNAEWREGEFEVCERGILVRRGDRKGFAKGLKYLLEYPDECKEMGMRGRKYALKKHTTERLVSDTDRLYRSLLERHSR